MSKTASNTPLPGFQYSRHQFEELVDLALDHAKSLGAADAAAEQAREGGERAARLSDLGHQHASALGRGEPGERGGHRRAADPAFARHQHDPLVDERSHNKLMRLKKSLGTKN